MAGNGNLEAVDKAVNSGLPLNIASENAMERLDHGIDQCRAIAHEGHAIETTAQMFADHLEKMRTEFHERLSERLVAVRQMLGKIGK